MSAESPPPPARKRRSPETNGAGSYDAVDAAEAEAPRSPSPPLPPPPDGVAEAVRGVHPLRREQVQGFARRDVRRR